MAQEDVFKKIVSHCKEYGFVFPSSDIYDGLAAVYDYGQNGVELKNNIKQYWWQSMVLLHSNIVGIDASIFMHPTVWKASGHVDAFNDPLIDNRDSKKRYRADNLIEDQIGKYEEKIAKEVAKAAKKFGDSFDEAKFRETNPRVLENQKKRDELHARYTEAMQGPDLEALDRRPPVQPHVLYRGGGFRRGNQQDLSPSGDGAGHLRQLPQRTEDRPYEAAVRHLPDRQGVPQ